LTQKVYKATVKNANSYYPNLLLCYDFAVTLEEPRFQDAIISKIMRRLRDDVKDQSLFVELLTESAVKKLANTYGLQLPMYKLAVRAAARFGTSNQLANFADAKFPHIFRRQVMEYTANLRERKDGQKDFADDECEFYRCGAGKYT
jgi:hypothetical protein